MMTVGGWRRRGRVRNTCASLLGALALGLGLGTAPAFADLTNDAFVNAEVLPSGYIGNLDQNFQNSKEVGEPDHAGNAGGASCWYSWTAPFTETVTIDTCNTNSANTLLAVYTGTQVDMLTPVASNDDGCGTQSILTFPAVAGTEYRIALDTFNGVGGSLAMSIRQTPVNDAFAAPTVLTGVPVSIGGTNQGATKETDEDDHAANVGGASVWYRWTASISAQVVVQTCASNFDTLLAVYTGAAVDALTPVASDDDSCGQGSILSFAATSGVTYMIAVDGTQEFAQGATGTIALDLVTLPPNDDFADAEALAGLPASAAGTCIGASEETGEPDHAGQPGGSSVWYGWTAPSNGQVTISLCGSDFDTVLGVYTGATVNGLTEVASDNDGCGGPASQVGLTATQGTTYLIAIDALGPAGTVDLAIAAGAPRPTTTTTSTIPGGTTTTTIAPGLAPDTTIDAGPKAKSRKRKVAFAFSASVPGATFECKLDAAEFAPCTSPLTMKVKLGRHVFQVRASDAGNTDPIPAEYRFKRRR
jgi:hypothetical protein